MRRVLRQFERQLAQRSRRSLEKSLNSLQKRLAEHLDKLHEIQKAGGHTSSVEREIRNFQQQIDAINQVLRGQQ